MWVVGRGEEEQSLGEGEERGAEERAEDSLMTFSSTLPCNKLTGGSEGQGRYRREWTMAGDLPHNSLRTLHLSLPLPLLLPSQSDPLTPHPCLPPSSNPPPRLSSIPEDPTMPCLTSCTLITHMHRSALTALT